MQLVKAALAGSLLLLTACSEPAEDKRLKGIVKLNCCAPGVLGNTEGFIIVTASWKLLHYEIESDTLKELTVSPGFRRGVEETWTIEKQDTTLIVTSREAYTENFLKRESKKALPLTQKSRSTG